MIKTRENYWERFEDAYHRGKSDKERGRMRVSPYYENANLDHFWFAGYDGRTLDEAHATDPRRVRV